MVRPSVRAHNVHLLYAVLHDLDNLYSKLFEPHEGRLNVPLSDITSGPISLLSRSSDEDIKQLEVAQEHLKNCGSLGYFYLSSVEIFFSH